MSDIQIKVNILGQLRLFKTVQFTDPYAFIDEALQNAQRAKATEVFITVSTDHISIKDNGEGLQDPESLFTMSQTGWDAETKSEQNPFGLGFFSCVALANRIEVQSLVYAYQFDVNKLFELGDPSIDYYILESPVDGFQVTLTELEESVDLATLTDKIKDSAKFISEYKTYINGELVESMDYTKTDGSDYTLVIEEPQLKGWIRPYKEWLDYSDHKELAIYHQNRFVKNLYISGVSGVLLVGKDILDFRAPDRRDIIDNDKLRTFIEAFKLTQVKTLMKSVVSTASDEVLDKYQDIIDNYLTQDDYRDSMRYYLLKDTDKIKKLETMSTAQLSWVSSDKLKELFLGEPQSVDTSNLESIEVIESSTRRVSEDSLSSRPSGSYVSYPDSAKISTKDIPRKILDRDGEAIDTFSDNSLIYYIEPRDLKSNYERILDAIKFKVPVVLVKNRLELKVLRELQNTKYLGTIDHKVVYRAEIENAGVIGTRERRANRMLYVLSSIAGFEVNVFCICSLVGQRHTIFGDLTVSSETVDKQIIKVDNRILVDRSIIEGSSIPDLWNNDLDLGDLFFVMKHLPDIVKLLWELRGKVLTKLEKAQEADYIDPEDEYLLTVKVEPKVLTSDDLLQHILAHLANKEIYDWLCS